MGNPSRERRWPDPWKPFRGRMTHWALRRQGADRLPLTLKARRLYILPTRAGLAFGALVAVAFIAGMNYGSGLAMLLTFWLCGFLFTAMLQTHRCLAGAQLLDATAEPAFAGEPLLLRLRLAGVAAGADLRMSESRRERLFTGADSPDHPGEAALTMELPTSRRGIWRAPVLLLATHAPFGLFRCWTWLQLDVRTEIYPRPLGNMPSPEAPGDNAGSLQMAAGLDELTWLRSFREGDSPRQVAWKAYARGMPLLVREYRGNSSTARELRFDQLMNLALEPRLSQLCAWVVDSAARGEYFSLVLPGHPPFEGIGPAHRDQCLAALARFDEAAAA